MIINLIVGLTKKKSLQANAKIELDLPNYATKADLRNATVADTSEFTKKN